NGAVSQDVADRWARAYLREQSIELWAGTTNRVNMLTEACLGASGSYNNLFATEVANIHRAKATGGHIQIDPLATLVSIAIVAAPPRARDYTYGLSGQRPQYAMVVTYRGPLASYIADDSGKRLQKLGSTAPGVTFSDANFG